MTLLKMPNIPSHSFLPFNILIGKENELIRAALDSTILFSFYQDESSLQKKKSMDKLLIQNDFSEICFKEL